MKLPRDLAGVDLAASLCTHYGYRRIHRMGSHIIPQSEQPMHHRLAIPDHNPVRLGALNAILRSVAAAKKISKETILRRLQGEK